VACKLPEMLGILRFYWSRARRQQPRRIDYK